MAGNVQDCLLTNRRTMTRVNRMAGERCEGFVKPPNTAFLGRTQLNANVNIDMRPIDFSKIFIDDEIMNIIVEQTNVYAFQKALGLGSGPNEPNENHYLAKWQEVTLDEIKVFLACVLNMGLVSKNNMKDYWVTSGLLGLQTT